MEGGCRAPRSISNWIAFGRWVKLRLESNRRDHYETLTQVAAMKFMRQKSIRVTVEFYCRYATQAKAVDVL
jgi:hypothetical protein